MRVLPPAVHAAALVAFLLFAACATPAQRIATKLQERGVPPREAQCVGDRLQSRLSIAQLKRLDTIVSANQDRLGRLTISDIARLFSAPADTRLAAEVLRAGLGCAI